MIKAANLKKRYGNIVALDDVSFEVDKGETFGLLKPDGGAVELDGKRDPSLVEVRLSLGVVPQALAIYEELSAEENLRFFGIISSDCFNSAADIACLCLIHLILEVLKAFPLGLSKKLFDYWRLKNLLDLVFQQSGNLRELGQVS